MNTRFWPRVAFWLRRFRRVRIRLSADGRYYYLDRGRARSWLSVATHSEPHPETGGRALDGWFKSGVSITKHATGETYWREVLPFTFYKVRSGEDRWVRADDDLVLDYEAAGYR